MEGRKREKKGGERERETGGRGGVGAGGEEDQRGEMREREERVTQQILH